MQEDQFLGRFLKKPITTLPVEGVVNVGAVDAIVEAKDSILKFSEARKLYLSLKGLNRTPNFYRAVERDCNILINLCGDKPIDQYIRTDATTLRDHLLKEGLAGKSIVRIHAAVQA